MQAEESHVSFLRNLPGILLRVQAALQKSQQRLVVLTEQTLDLLRMRRLIGRFAWIAGQR